MNSDSSEAPSTISGVASGRKMKKFVGARPRNWYRTSASAIIVPSAVAITVDSAAIWIELTSASCRPGTPNGSFQCSSVNPCQVKLNLPAGSLNENRMMIAIGASR